MDEEPEWRSGANTPENLTISVRRSPKASLGRWTRMTRSMSSAKHSQPNQEARQSHMTSRPLRSIYRVDVVWLYLLEHH